MRLRSVVADRPKVLAPIDRKPFLAHLLDQLAAQGLRRVVLCTGYLGEQVQACFGHEYRGMRLSYSRESRPLGTGGALRQALPLLASETVLVLNGDSYCRADLARALDFHRTRRARATVVLAHVDQGKRYGRVQLAADGRILAFCEKGGDEGAGWINSGIYWFEHSVLAALPTREPLSLEREILAAGPDQGLYGFPQSGPFLDIGIPEDYARAERFLEEIHEAPFAVA